MPDLSIIIAGDALMIMLIITAIAVGKQRNLFAAVMLMSIFSLLSASLFVCMDAMDVAFTEAAVGAGISTLMFLAVLALVGHEEEGRSRNQWSALALCILCGSMMLIGLGDMPMHGDPNAPVNAYLSPWYEKSTAEDIGIPNVVTAILASYRGYDTFGEVTVIFTALTAILMLLGRSNDTAGKRKKETQTTFSSLPGDSKDTASGVTIPNLLRRRYGRNKEDK